MLCPSPHSSHPTTPPGKERKNQDGLGQEWDKSGARENPGVLEGQLHQMGITESSLTSVLSLASSLRLCGTAAVGT